MSRDQQPVCLTIAGLDPSGGAGIAADLKTFAAFGCFGTAAVTSLTFQNTTGVFGVANQSGEIVEKQCVPVFEDFEVAAVKTGMLPSADVIEAVARLADRYRPPHLVVDPVVRSTSGHDLIDDKALESLKERLFPLADIVTPNIPEAERIAKMPIADEDDVRRAGEKMLAMGARTVLIKGGHGTSDKAIDRLMTPDGEFSFEADLIETNATHGTGCTLAAAIAAGLARGSDLHGAVATAKRFVTEAIRSSPRIGKGFSPINHLIVPEKLDQ